MQTTVQLSELPTSSLVKLHNNVTGESVKRFSTKTAGIQRVAKALEDKNVAKLDEATGDCIPLRSGFVFDEDKLDVVALEAAPAKSAKKKVAKKTAAKKTAAKKTAAKKETPKGVTKGHALKGRRQGVGAFIRELILKNDLPIDGIVKAVHEEFPGSTATKRDVYWNRSKLRQEGRL